MKFKIKYIFIFFLCMLLCVGLCFTTSCKDNKNELDSYTICQQMNDFIAEAKKSGLQKQIEDKWYTYDETNKTINYDELTGEAGNLTVATFTSLEPFSYFKDGQYVGIAMDLLFHFAKQYGYKITYNGYNSMSSIIADVNSGKSIMAAGPISLTEERMKSVSFSDAYFVNHVDCVTKIENLEVYANPKLLNGKNIGIIMGASTADIINSAIDNANIIEYENVNYLSLALQKGDIDAYYCDDSLFRFFKINNTTDEVAYYAGDEDYAYMFKKFGYQSLSELSNKKIGTLGGSVYETYVKSNLPSAQILTYATIPDAVLALNKGSIDAVALETSLAYEPLYEYENVYKVNQILGSTDVAAAFPKTEEGFAERNQFNLFLNDLMATDDFTNLLEKWDHFLEPNFDSDIPYETLENINGEFNISVDPTLSPLTYMAKNKCTGFEIELAYLYCKKMGYSLNIHKMNFSGLLESLEKNDAIFSGVCVTEERSQSVYFSTSYYTSDIFLVVKSNVEDEVSFFESVKESFIRTFITEKRYELFGEGLLTTLSITFFSIIGGIIFLGFSFSLYRAGNKIIKKIIDIINSTITFIPTIVVLLITYYIIFKTSSLSNVAVSIVCFSVLFGITLLGKFIVCVDSIDKSQFEAAYSLGYSKQQTFIKIILPQTTKMFLPVFKIEIVMLIKETAIAGYIAVQDLTKVSDIIRSRTYDAFFPLIAIAVIYYLIARLLILFVNVLSKLLTRRYLMKKALIKEGENNND